MTAHTITVEPLTASLRRQTCHERTPGHLAIVERIGPGRLVKVCQVTDTYGGVYDAARRWAATYGATVCIASSYAPTVVGQDVADHVATRADCQPRAAAEVTS